uniref:DNTTIP1_dimer domain-containing protein n=1 Tax=Mesocestoides corti TaxID=53468 RepID=A0A5K3EZ17_MESCO
MSAEFNKDLLQFNSLSPQNTFMTPPLNTKPDLHYYPVPKTEDMYPSVASDASPITSLLNASRSDVTSDFVASAGETTEPFAVQMHPDSPSTPTPTISTSHLNMRYRNMLNFPKYLHKKSRAFEKRIRRSGINPDPVYALTILQRFIQPFINREIDAVISKYSKDFLAIAIENIRYNLGERAVSENELQLLQYNIMKDATAQYRVPSFDPPPPQSRATPTITVTGTPVDLSSLAATTTTDLRRSVLRSSTRLRQRTNSGGNSYSVGGGGGGGGGGGSSAAPSSPPLSDNVSLMLLQDADGVGSPFPLTSLDEETASLAKRRRLDAEKADSLRVEFLDNAASLNGSPVPAGDASTVVDALGPLELELPDNTSHGQASSTPSEAPSSTTANSFHSASHPPPQFSITDTFVLGSCANAWLGLGAARGRIYSKHPWIFRYACDREDKVWLARAGRLPNCGSKAFLMLAKQIRGIAEVGAPPSATTREPLADFTIPSWLFQKVLDSATARASNSRLSGNGGNGVAAPAVSRHFVNNAAARQPASQRSNFIDQFDFTEEDDCRTNFFNEGGHPTWSGGKGLHPLKNGRTHAVRLSQLLVKMSLSVAGFLAQN